MTKHTHKGKLMILKMVLENWGYNEGQKYSDGDDIGKLYLADWDRVCYLLDSLKKRKIPGFCRGGLNKDEMEEMNFLFRRYDGKRG